VGRTCRTHEEKKNACGVLVVKTPLGTIRRCWEDNITISSVKN
jgi:hypothetical protein